MFSLKTNKAPLNSKQIFDYQLCLLEKRGCPPSMTDVLSGNKKQVLARASLMNVADEHIPFLPVITACYLGYHGLMALVRHNDRCGVVECEVVRISDFEEVPLKLYYIFDVSDGVEWQGRIPEVTHTLICQNGRLPVTAIEAMNIALQTGFLAKHPLYAVGSRYASDRTPMVWLNVIMPEANPNSMGTADAVEAGISLLKSELGQPSLGWWYSSSPIQGGAPSCASRLEI